VTKTQLVEDRKLYRSEKVEGKPRMETTFDIRHNFDECNIFVKIFNFHPFPFCVYLVRYFPKIHWAIKILKKALNFSFNMFYLMYLFVMWVSLYAHTFRNNTNWVCSQNVIIWSLTRKDRILKIAAWAREQIAPTRKPGRLFQQKLNS